MGISLETKIEYRPKFDGNEKSDNPAVFHITVMGGVEFRNFFIKLQAMQKGQPEEVGIDPGVIRLYRDAVAAHIPAVENLEIDGQQITTGAEFYDHPGVPYKLLTEIENAVVNMNQLAPEETKN